MQRATIPDADINSAEPETLIYCFTPWVQKIANRYRAFLKNTNAVGMEDLEQVGKIALLTAQKKYDPACGTSFLHYSCFYIRRAIRKELGFTSDGRLPMIIQSLDEPLDEHSEESRIDLVEDETIEPNDERIQRLERYEELHRAIGRLKNDKHREIIERIYFDEQEKADAASAMGMTMGAFYAANKQALSKLRRDPPLYILCAPTFSGSLSKFRITLTSTVEAEILWKEKRLEERYGDGAFVGIQIGPEGRREPRQRDQLRRDPNRPRRAAGNPGSMDQLHQDPDRPGGP